VIIAIVADGVSATPALLPLSDDRGAPPVLEQAATVSAATAQTAPTAIGPRRCRNLIALPLENSASRKFGLSNNRRIRPADLITVRNDRYPSRIFDDYSSRDATGMRSTGPRT